MVNQREHEMVAARRVALVDEFDLFVTQYNWRENHAPDDVRNFQDRQVSSMTFMNFSGAYIQERWEPNTGLPTRVAGKDLLTQVLSQAQEQVRLVRDRAAVLQRAASGQVDVAMITAETNSEVRRAMLEVYGFERFMTDVGAKVVQRDEVGELLEWMTESQFPHPQHLAGLSPAAAHAFRSAWRVKAVRVRNSTPEKDGTFRTYVLRVPADVQTCREGVAWTFGLREQEYRPEVMT